MARSPVDPAANLEANAWSDVDDAVEKLEDSWRAADGGNIGEFVPPTGHPQRERILIELIKVDQEYRWEKKARYSMRFKPARRMERGSGWRSLDALSSCIRAH